MIIIDIYTVLYEASLSPSRGYCLYILFQHHTVNVETC